MSFSNPLNPLLRGYQWENDLIRDEFELIRQANPVSITITRKGTGELLPQTVRIAQAGGAAERRSPQVQSVQMKIVVLGNDTFDVQKNDTFVYRGDLYRVIQEKVTHDQIGVRVEAIKIGE